jgi:hypothetical protein
MQRNTPQTHMTRAAIQKTCLVNIVYLTKENCGRLVRRNNAHTLLVGALDRRGGALCAKPFVFVQRVGAKVGVVRIIPLHARLGQAQDTTRVVRLEIRLQLLHALLVDDRITIAQNVDAALGAPLQVQHKYPIVVAPRGKLGQARHEHVAQTVAFTVFVQLHLRR